MKENIGGFNIPMKNAIFVQHSKGIDQLCEIHDRIMLIDHFLCFDLILQGASIAEFINQVVMGTGLEHFDELDYVGMVDF